MSCTGPNALNPACRIGEIAASAANDAFSNIAGWFGKAASQATTWLWQEIGSATSVRPDSPPPGTGLFVTSALPPLLALATFPVHRLRPRPTPGRPGPRRAPPGRPARPGPPDPHAGRGGL